MATSPPQKPAGSFAEQIEQPPAGLEAASDGSKKLEVIYDGKTLGFLGQSAHEWCAIVPEPLATCVEEYTYKGDLYLRNASDISRYLSVSDGSHYVGFYNWTGARAWKWDGDRLMSQYTNCPLSYYADTDLFLYANCDYKILTVRPHPC